METPSIYFWMEYQSSINLFSLYVSKTKSKPSTPILNATTFDLLIFFKVNTYLYTEFSAFFLGKSEINSIHSWNFSSIYEKANYKIQYQIDLECHFKSGGINCSITYCIMHTWAHARKRTCVMLQINIYVVFTIQNPWVSRYVLEHLVSLSIQILIYLLSRRYI